MVTKTPERTPWAGLPRELAREMEPRVGRLQTEILGLIAATDPWSERMTLPSVRADFVAVTSTVVNRFVQLVGTSAPTFTDAERARFRDVGAGEAREGRGLEELLSAYRIGIRVLYAAFARALAELDPSPQVQVALGEAVFALSDALQAESADGYAHEISTHAGERERRLRRLTDALFAGEEDAVRAVAAQVGWTPPETLAVLLVPVDATSAARGALGAHGFVVEWDAVGVAVVAGRSVARTVPRLAGIASTALRVGPTVPLLEARRSLVAAQLLPDDVTGDPVWAVDRLPELLTRGEPEVAAILVERALAPLDALRDSQRDRLTETLSAWLRHWGQRTEIAAELGVHPQTVAYRVNQLRDLFGAVLDDPDRRLELQLALLAAPAR